ncbi:MAG: anaerobic carbon-monoxide dehydrogenase catalytic subunit [Candidatus Kryptonium sp.]|nr:anaerobic carbon-monoxide dehydrogenase catalytic subunit [Candidatus Kryptonium sp.]MCX7763205.1 anaerobic carbon-monoxide dehydrogenase catalytic subunit [Candidatus Kryptonium sp.]MDW8109181.1 anaerobic carbon-monoxide dehydrogenase catalytic subunit [Candidatus Kryptonium sp.]
MADILKDKERVWESKSNNYGLLPESNIELLKKEARESKTTSLQRLALQEPQCGFGELGVCCRMCYMGPCRIDVFNGGPRVGVCGATADVIVARNLLRETVGGAAAHTEHAMDIAEVLKEVAEGKISTYTIKDEEKLKRVAENLGIKTEGKDIKEIAKEVAEISLEDFRRLEKEPAVWLKAYTPKSSYEQLEKLGVIPHNVWRPIMNAMHRTSMGNDADTVNIMLADLQMGLIDGLGLIMATELSDVLFGTPKPIHSWANLAVIKQDFVNIAVHGHNPLLSEKIVEWANKLNDKAKALGAKGINIVGVCCTGNEVLMRHGVPMAGNEFQAELAIATGALDAMVVDYQCVWPILSDVASCYHTKLITTISFVKIPGAIHIEYSPEKADEIAQKVIETALEAYKKRDPAKVFIPDSVEEVVAGFSVEALIDILKKINPEDPLKPLIDNIVNGNIFGVVAIVGCPNPKTRRLAFTERMIKGLIKNNVLVIVTGCTAHIAGQSGFLNPNKVDSFEVGEGLKQVLKALGNVAGLNSLPVAIHMGSCVDNSRIGFLLKALSEKLGLKVSDLPVVASAPELISEKAISIGTWALALGVTVHVCPPPRVLGGPKVTEILTKDLKTLTGGEAYVECDPELAVKGILDRIKQKRIALNLPIPELVLV